MLGGVLVLSFCCLYISKKEISILQVCHEASAGVVLVQGPSIHLTKTGEVDEDIVVRWIFSFS